MFCREINQSILDSTPDVSSAFLYSGSYQILIDLKVVNRAGSYAYLNDRFGARNPADESYGDYRQRKNLIKFSENNHSTNNEVMIKNRIPPEFIRGVLCQTDEAKQILVDQLRKDGLVITKDGKEYYLDKPVDDFIHVGNNFQKEMWNK